jgi:hypothetical protein
MNNMTSNLIGSNKVEVLDEYEFVDHATRHHHATALEQGAVWSSQVGSMRHMRFLPYIHEWLNFDWFKTAGHVGLKAQLVQAVTFDHGRGIGLYL